MDVQTSSIIHVYSTTVRKIIYNVFRNNLCWSLFVVSSSCAHSEILKKCEMLPISIDKQGVKKIEIYKVSNMENPWRRLRLSRSEDGK